MQDALSRDQIREVDRLAIEELGIPGVVLMENAGRNCAEQIRRRLRPDGGARVIVFCGPGNNGGDGFVIARHLTNAGAVVQVYLAGDPERLRGESATNHAIARKMGLPVEPIADEAAAREAAGTIRQGDVIVDALLGTGFSGEVREPMATLVVAMNDAPKALGVAVDVPSGLDCDNGSAAAATFRADLTITFVAPKRGLIKPEAGPWVGELVTCDIGAPRSLIDRVRG